MKQNIKIFAFLITVVLLSGIGCVKTQAADMTLKNGKWTNGTLSEDVTVSYYKVSVKKTGYLKIEYVRDCEDASAVFQICNNKKEKIWKREEKFNHAATAYFPVKKGTYYICIEDIMFHDDGGADDDDEIVWNETENYKIKYTFTAMKEGKKINKLEDAPLLKKKRQVSGLIFPDKKSHDMCYKFIVSKNSKVKFSYEVFGLWLRIADSKGKFINFDSKGRIQKKEILLSGGKERAAIP